METDAALRGARQALADYLNGAPEEIVFGANMTTLTFHLGRALGRELGPGDEIVVTELDHHANVDTWRALERERGLTLRWVRLDTASGRLDEGDLAQAIGPRTRLVAVGAGSNALGTITDVTPIVARAHAAGALVFVDAVHLAAHRAPDVRALGCDFLACSAYKFYGPHVGVLWGRRELLERLDAPKLWPAPEAAPERLETGTLNHEGVVGAGAAVDFLASLDPGPGSRRERLVRVSAALHERGERLLRRLWEGLGSIPGVCLYGPPPGTPRTPTVSFVVERCPAEQVARALAEVGVFVSHGDFYATTVVARLGRAADGLVRAGCAAYTTDDEVERLLEGVRAVSG
jgi:cysteine desulfurase family protein (TIGR01976 family)